MLYDALISMDEGIPKTWGQIQLPTHPRPLSFGMPSSPIMGLYPTPSTSFMMEHYI
jgi:hypothetical protein